MLVSICLASTYALKPQPNVFSSKFQMASCDFCRKFPLSLSSPSPTEFCRTETPHSSSLDWALEKPQKYKCLPSVRTPIHPSKPNSDITVLGSSS